MKIDTKKHIIRQLTLRNTHRGFTLVELLVVVIIIGILSAISLPVYLSLAASAKQVEAKQNIAAIMTAQHLWLDENSSGTYPTSLDQLAIGIAKGSGKVDSTSSSVYTYRIADSTNQMSVGANPKDDKLKTYSGGIRSFANAAAQATWYSISCESASVNESLSYPVPSGTVTDATLTCPDGYNRINVGGK